MRGVLFDQSAVVAVGCRRGRTSPPGSDLWKLFRVVPEGGDAYVLKPIIHDWGDAEAVRILA